MLDYQSEENELNIVRLRFGGQPTENQKALSLAAVRVTRATRHHPRVRRGASVRAALSIAELGATLMDDGRDFQSAFLEAVTLALPTRIEIERETATGDSSQAELEALLRDWAKDALASLGEAEVKKKI